ncbi:MAG: hypothetical protein QM535_18335 [Limnohabitans sp.]|nr:hypothetical protein [Limnohabitans sp.]
MINITEAMSSLKVTDADIISNIEHGPKCINHCETEDKFCLYCDKGFCIKCPPHISCGDLAGDVKRMGVKTYDKLNKLNKEINQLIEISSQENKIADFVDEKSLEIKNKMMNYFIEAHSQLERMEHSLILQLEGTTTLIKTDMSSALNDLKSSVPSLQSLLQQKSGLMRTLHRNPFQLHGYNQVRRAMQLAVDKFKTVPRSSKDVNIQFISKVDENIKPPKHNFRDFKKITMFKAAPTPSSNFKTHGSKRTVVDIANLADLDEFISAPLPPKRPSSSKINREAELLDLTQLKFPQETIVDLAEETISLCGSEVSRSESFRESEGNYVRHREVNLSTNSWKSRAAQFVKNFVDVQLIKDNSHADMYINVQITNFKDPSYFFVRNESLIAEYEKLETILREAPAEKISKVERNKFYLYKDPETNNMLRIKVIEKKDDGNYLIKHTDSGREIIAASNFYQLKDPIMQMKPFALQCSLAFIKPKSAKFWTNSYIDAAIKSTRSLNIEYCSALFHFYYQNRRTYYITLVTKQGIDFGTHLVLRNIAEKTFQSANILNTIKNIECILFNSNCGCYDPGTLNHRSHICQICGLETHGSEQCDKKPEFLPIVN